ncbi:MAG: hypothetical protein GY859_12365 [Desulfobacterales bacterium]|nr:hypothetical protein [Desulfobacterales bacterium]
MNADWWVAAATPFSHPDDWYSYVYPAGWRKGLNPCVQTPVCDFSSYEVLNGALPPGDYTFYFGLDDPDGVALGPFWNIDSVDVHVSKE